MLSEEEGTEYKEVHWFNSDQTVPQFDSEMRINHWSASVESYLSLSKLVLASITCFHGPLEQDSHRLENYLKLKGSFEKSLKTKFVEKPLKTLHRP